MSLILKGEFRAAYPENKYRPGDIISVSSKKGVTSPRIYRVTKVYNDSDGIYQYVHYENMDFVDVPEWEQMLE